MKQGVYSGCVDASIAKAKSAARFEIDAITFYDLARKQNLAIGTIPGILPAAGGGRSGVQERSKILSPSLRPETAEFETVDILALLRALPVLELAPNVVATIDGFLVPRDTRGIDAHAEKCTEYVNATINLLEPPAGQYVPYIDPVAAMVVILGTEGKDRKDVVQQAGASLTELKTFSRANRWVCFFNDYEPDSPECLPVLDFIAWLRQKAGASNAIVDFVARVAEIAPDLTIFTGPDNASEPWALTDLPALPQPKEMIEFVPRAPWYDDEWGKRETWGIDGNPFVRWRESIRPIAASLSAALGESMYHFADWRCDTDDDLIHRFLVLHWCCSYKPNSTYVQYLVKVLH